jgi:hypothetical protein
VSTSSEGYSSWLPKCPLPPQFNPPLAQHGNDVWLRRWCRSRRAPRGSQHQTYTTFRSHRQQDSNAATTATCAGGRREPRTDRRTTTRVSSSAGATPHVPLTLLHRSPCPPLSFFRSLYGPVPRKRLRSEDSRQSPSQTLDARLPLRVHLLRCLLPRYPHLCPLRATLGPVIGNC